MGITKISTTTQFSSLLLKIISHFTVFVQFSVSPKAFWDNIMGDIYELIAKRSTRARTQYSTCSHTEYCVLTPSWWCCKMDQLKLIFFFLCQRNIAWKYKSKYYFLLIISKYNYTNELFYSTHLIIMLKMLHFSILSSHCPKCVKNVWLPRSYIF